MNNPQTVEQAQEAVDTVLATLQITRVVCVDDAYEDEPSVEEVVVAAGSLDPETLQRALPEIGSTVPADQDVVNQQIRRAWAELDEPTRSQRAEVILTAGRLRDNDAGADDLGDASILADLIGKDRLTTLSPKEWDEQCDTLLKEDRENVKQRTLFLFDRDLSTNGGDTEGGIKIIASLLADSATGNLICGLLTHTVTPEEQPEKWIELSNTYSIPRDRFLVIPKQHLSKDPILFAQTLKLVALSPDFTELMEKTKAIIRNAASRAAIRIDGISIYDLDYIVFQVSADEGLWEPDMLFRLHALFHRLESRRLAHEGGELETIANRLRAVSHIPTHAEFSPPSSTWRIQRDELYESADHLNRNHLPVELGDIFAKTDSESKKRYILLAQPCDLMVRNSGKRQPELTHIPLAEVAPTSKRPNYAEELTYFGDGPNERWYVKLKQAHQVRACVLDLCAFNDDGSATIQIGADAPGGIRPTLKARHSILSKLFGRLLRRLDLLAPVRGESPEVLKTKDTIRPQLTDDLLDEGLFKGKRVDANGHTNIIYNCQRVGRLSRARAFGLLMAYTGCLSRPAYDRDFG